MDKGGVLRRKLEFYERRLREGVSGVTARVYLQEIARTRAELKAVEAERGDREPSRGHRLEWSDSFSIGHAEIDAEHRDVLGRINELCIALDAKKKIPADYSDLRGLLQAVEHHLEHEIAIIQELTARATVPDHVRATGKAIQEKHAVQHEEDLSRLRSIVAAIEHSSAAAGPRCADELVKWFIDHAISSDAVLKTIFQPA